MAERETVDGLTTDISRSLVRIRVSGLFFFFLRSKTATKKNSVPINETAQFLMRTFRSVVFRLFKADADGCSVSRLTQYTSYHHPRQPVLRQTAAGGPRTSNRQTVNKTHWSSTVRRLSSTTFCPYLGHRMPLHIPTSDPNAFRLFCTGMHDDKKIKKHKAQSIRDKVKLTSPKQKLSVRVAQLVERWSNKPLVLGSIPNVNTLFFFFLFAFFFFNVGQLSLHTKPK